jgi:hypothetical protein
MNRMDDCGFLTLCTALKKNHFKAINQFTDSPSGALLTYTYMHMYVKTRRIIHIFFPFKMNYILINVTLIQKYFPI